MKDTVHEIRKKIGTNWHSQENIQNTNMNFYEGFFIVKRICKALFNIFFFFYEEPTFYNDNIYKLFHRN